MPTRDLFACIVAVPMITGSIALAAVAQDEPEANPAALKAFTELVQSYRERAGLTIASTVTIELTDAENPPTTAKGTEVKGEFLFGRDRHAVITLRGYTCYLRQDPATPGYGTISAVHERTDHSYFTASDDGSPYYALLNAFKDMPFPELAIMLGEDDIDDVLLQLHPRAADGLVPTALTTVKKDGQSRQQLTLSGPNEMLQMWIDPASRLIDSIEMRITGGRMVRDGAVMVYTHRYEHTVHEQPLDAKTFAFDAGQRQRVDVMASLLPHPTPAAARAGGDDDDGGAVAAAPALVGQPAPNFILATADGQAVDLQELRGKVVVLDFWASWCGPCIAALPKLHEVAKWASDEQMPVKVLTINVWEVRGEGDSPDARLQSATATWKKRNFTLPIVMDYTDDTAMAYGVRGIPTAVVIRSDGIVHTIHVGAGGDYVAQMKRDIKEAIAAAE